MPEKIFEIKVVDQKHISPEARAEVIKKVARAPPEFRNKFKGFVKVTYVTASPPRVSNIEPISGTPSEYYEEVETEVGGFGVF